MDMSSLKPGRYIIAVSGGVDSMCLLHMMRDKPELELIVAHFNHRQRDDAASDAALVKATATKYGFIYRGGMAAPDQKPDENSLRIARYAFLRKVMHEQGAQAIVTAHHQDDVLETIILQLLRGAHRKGLSPMQASTDIMRPMLTVTKAQLRMYASEHAITWREDTSNEDLSYRRNYVRAVIMPKLTVSQRQAFLDINKTMTPLNQTIDMILEERLATYPDRRTFIALPHAVSREYLAAWLRRGGITDFTAPMLERLTIAAKTLPAGKAVDVMNGAVIYINGQSLALETRERYNKETYGQ